MSLSTEGDAWHADPGDATSIKNAVLSAIEQDAASSNRDETQGTGKFNWERTDVPQNAYTEEF